MFMGYGTIKGNLCFISGRSVAPFQRFLYVKLLMRKMVLPSFPKKRSIDFVATEIKIKAESGIVGVIR